MGFSAGDLTAIWLTIRLASIVTVILLIVGTPIAWWLSQTKSRFKAPIAALLALPLILPPTVIGFYLLIAFAPNGFIGQFTNWVGIGNLAFTFWGLVVASCIYSLPFVVQPLQNIFATIGKQPLEAAATLGASPIDRFFSVVAPMAKSGFITATVLGFAHTVGEFGVVMMIGGNIEGETKVVSVAIYEHVEALEYIQAHSLSVLMLIFSFATLLILYMFQQRKGKLGMGF